MLKRILILLMMIISLPSFATDVSGGETCDTDVLNTDTGPVNLRAEFEPETINLKWYNGNNQITVPTASNSCTYDTPISLPANPTKPGYKFKGWNIIPGTLVEYIQSTGKQWINTGIIGNEKTWIEVSYQNFTDTTNKENVLLGAATNTYPFYDQNIGINLSKLQSQVLFYDNCDGYTNIQRQSAGIISIKPDGMYVYGNKITPTTGQVPSDTAFTTTSPIDLFCMNAAGQALYCASVALNYVKIWQDTGLVRDYIPIKDYNNVPCMYDRVSKQCFYNSGTGDFIAGPEI